jgi:hypothetical protein
MMILWANFMALKPPAIVNCLHGWKSPSWLPGITAYTSKPPGPAQGSIKDHPPESRHFTRFLAQAVGNKISVKIGDKIRTF